MVGPKHGLPVTLALCGVGHVVAVSGIVLAGLIWLSASQFMVQWLR